VKQSFIQTYCSNSHVFRSSEPHILPSQHFCSHSAALFWWSSWPLCSPSLVYHVPHYSDWNLIMDGKVTWRLSLP